MGPRWLREGEDLWRSGQGENRKESSHDRIEGTSDKKGEIDMSKNEGKRPKFTMRLRTSEE